MDKIKIYRGGKEHEVETTLPEEYLERQQWVEDTLATFFRSTKCGIKMIKYYYFGEEMIRVFYDSEGIYFKDVWITGDSYAAIVEDMYRQRVIY